MTVAIKQPEIKPCGLSANAWRKLQRDHLPGYDPYATVARGDYFDPDAANDVIDFFTGLLVFIEGDKAGEPFVLEPWQMAATGATFGWMRKNGKRRYREVFRYVPRKNGKTPWLAGEVAYIIYCDREPGAQIYSAAADRDQAGLVYRHVEGMIAREPILAGRVMTHRSYKTVEYPDYDTFYKVLSSDARTKHGFQVHMAAIDELHAHRSRELMDVLVTGTANRSQPLVIYITTADFDRESACNEKHDYACKVRDGIIEDRAFLPVIYEADRDDDWTDPKIWAKANPNLNVSVSLEYLERECKKAQDQPTYENTFKRLHLNIKTEQDVRWVQMDRWDACCDDVTDPMRWRLERLESLKGQPCVGAMDMSTTTDLTCFGLIFGDTEGGVEVLPWFWIPAERADLREKRDRVPYVTWARQGWIEMTDGNVIDYEHIKHRIGELRGDYDIRKIAYDPWNATQLALQLQEYDGMNMVEFRQGFVSMNEPTKEFERLIMAALFGHGGNPVLRWMASNVSAKTDPAGNIKLDKAKSNGRIDGLIVSVMGIGLLMAGNDDQQYFAGGIA